MQSYIVSTQYTNNFILTSTARYRAVASLLLIVASFIVGKSLGPQPTLCGGDTSLPNQGVGKTFVNDGGTSPEGPVSGSFDERYDFRGRPREVISATGTVAADHGRCSEMGLGALKDGGNAVDAAVMTALCQGIYNPMASGVGGGHLMIIR